MFLVFPCLHPNYHTVVNNNTASAFRTDTAKPLIPLFSKRHECQNPVLLSGACITTFSVAGLYSFRKFRVCDIGKL